MYAPRNIFWTELKFVVEVFQIWLNMSDYIIILGVVCMRAESCPNLCDPMNCVACQAPPSMRFSRQEYCSGLPFLSSGELPNPGIEPTAPATSTLAGRFFTTAPTYYNLWLYIFCLSGLFFQYFWMTTLKKI